MSVSPQARARSIPACAGEPSGSSIWSSGGRVYPRVCGGNHQRQMDEGQVLGSIPACAGEPGLSPRVRGNPGVYPRVCGGTEQERRNQARDDGLSPRVRGNRRCMMTWSTAAGSIPACAGEPGNLPPRRRRRWVYPRVCGGTMARAFVCPLAWGLSPRVRGNHIRIVRLRQIRRSIPACAGEPLILPPPSWAGPVYPRVCGGTTPPASQTPNRKGLSPRVRGNRARAKTRAEDAGSIPACAGEPPPPGTPRRRPQVYPRVCGGTDCRANAHANAHGLSPRVRGNLSRMSGALAPWGSIPACAGEPAATPTRRPAPGVYPRVCGGTYRVPQDAGARSGLSPRVRGNPNGKPAVTAIPRSIPACSGEPMTTSGRNGSFAVYPRVCGGTRRRRRWVVW